MEEAMILECITGGGANGVAVRLSTGHFLPREHLLRIAQRYSKRGNKDVWELQPKTDLYPISQCTRDKTLNNQFDNHHATFANGIKDLCASINDLAQNFESVLNNDMNTSNITLPSINVQESPARVTPDSPRDDKAAQILQSASSSDMNTCIDADQPSDNKPPARKVVALDRPKQDLKPSNDKNTSRIVSSSRSSSIVDSPLHSAPVIPTILPVAKLTNKGGQKRVRDAIASEFDKENKRRTLHQRVNEKSAPDWKSTLHRLLADCTVARTKRRADYAKIETCEAALNVAIEIRQRLDEVDAPTTDCLIDEWHEEMECSRDRVWDFLSGNPKNLLSVDVLRNMTATLQHWLNEASDGPKTVSQNEPSSVATHASPASKAPVDEDSALPSKANGGPTGSRAECDQSSAASNIGATSIAPQQMDDFVSAEQN
jgi:hypothetical protein